MLSWLLHKWSWKSFAAGAGAALFGGTIARPVLVQAVKTGMEVQEYAAHTYLQARYEFEKVRAEAAALRAVASQSHVATNEILSEIQKLRDEVASLRTVVATKTTVKP